MLYLVLAKRGVAGEIARFYIELRRQILPIECSRIEAGHSIGQAFLEELQTAPAGCRTVFVYQSVPSYRLLLAVIDGRGDQLIELARQCGLPRPGIEQTLLVRNASGRPRPCRKSQRHLADHDVVARVVRKLLRPVLGLGERTDRLLPRRLARALEQADIPERITVVVDQQIIARNIGRLIEHPQLQ